MEVKDNNGLVLFVDIDDFLVRSSPKIQDQVDKKTGFKADTLRMLEQTIRNCKYYTKYVSEECAKAYRERRMPKLDEFLLRSVGISNISPFYFDSLTDEDKKKIYMTPVDKAREYIDAASQIFNQFLEERDTFLEIDNMAFGDIKKFDMAREKATIERFRGLLEEKLYGLIKINEFCLIEIERIVYEARSKNVRGALIIPDYGDLIRMDSNDVLKQNSISTSTKKEDILYKKPVETIRNCYFNKDHFYDILRNFTVFSTPSAEIIDYDGIYRKVNVNFAALNLVQKLLESGRFTACYALTHHNGDREEIAKRRFIKEILPQIGFVGLRFHPVEHDAERRMRNPKIDYVLDNLPYPAERVVLLDDSLDNCRTWANTDRTETGERPLAILYKPYTDSEIINGVPEKNPEGIERIPECNYIVVRNIIDDKIAKLTKIDSKVKKIGGKKDE